MERIDDNKPEAGRGAVFVIGVVLVMAGLLLIGDQLNLFPFRVRYILISWQLLLILMGLIFLSKKEERVPGIILLSIGVIFPAAEINNSAC